MSQTRADWADLDAEYAAKGWPSINPFRRDYCYQPCNYGLHVCGYHPDGNNCLTIANLPTPTIQEARELFERAKAECACAPGEPDDFIVDLMNGVNCEDDFPMSRQMLDRLKALHQGADHD